MTSAARNSTKKWAFDMAHTSNKKCSIWPFCAWSPYVSKSLFDKVAALRLSCEYCKISKNSFIHKKRPVAVSDKFINLIINSDLTNHNLFWKTIECKENLYSIASVQYNHLWMISSKNWLKWIANITKKQLLQFHLRRFFSQSLCLSLS